MINDEIKKIIDDLLFTTTLPNVSIKLNKEKLNQLKDYITNLQQENERLKLEIERLNDVLVHKPDEKITLKTQDGKEMFIIQSERIDMQEELNKANMQLMTQLQDYKSRCEKAVEYIQNHQLVFELSSKKVISQWFDMFYKDILNILNGSDE